MRLHLFPSSACPPPTDFDRRNRPCSSCVLRGECCHPATHIASNLTRDNTIGHASLCYSADDKDPSTSPRGSPVASSVQIHRFVFHNAHLTDPDAPRSDSPSTSTVNATSEFRKIRQSLSLLESHLTTVQRAPKSLPDAPQSEPRTQPQRGLLAHLSSPLSSWPTQLNPGVGPTGWISYLGMRVRFVVIIVPYRRATDGSSVFSLSQTSKRNHRLRAIAVLKPFWLAMSRTTTSCG